MAQIRKNADGSLSVALDAVEQSTFDWIEGTEPGKLEAYVSLWLKDRSIEAFSQKFEQLSDQDKAAVMQKLSDVRQKQKKNMADGSIPVVTL